jgi:phospholipase C
MSAVVDKALAAADPAGCGSLDDIEHFVFVMQENRSFDHYFGTLSGVRGFDDPAVPTQTVGGRTYPVWNQFGWAPGIGATATGYTQPFALLEDSTHDGQWLNDPTHDWAPQHQSWNGGAMDNWLRTHVAVDGAANAPIIMGHYNRSTLPFYYALADAFTVCDAYHCSVLGPTYPNRLYWMSGMIDPEGQYGGPLVETFGSLTPQPQLYSAYSWKTMPEVLEEAGVSWKVYQSPDSIEGLEGGLLMDNVLRYFKQYNNVGSLNQKGLVPTIGFNPATPGNFEIDVATNNLPSVSWIVTDFLLCEHPAAPPQYGQYALAHILDTLVSNPAVWEKTALILSYDENGGFFDHVPPPTPPPGTPGEYITVPLSTVAEADGISGPIGLGFRVPCLVVSPYSRGGLVYSGVSDHTSQLRLVEARFDTPVPNLSQWRRSAVSDLTGAFDFATAPDTSPPVLPAVPTPAAGLTLGGSGGFSIDTTSTAEVDEQGVTNGVLATDGMGSPYPVPPNSRPSQEPGPQRRQPSGMVCAAPALPGPGAGSSSPSSGRGSTGSSSPPTVGATPAGAPVTGLADTGVPAITILGSIALLAAGGVMTAASSQEAPGPMADRGAPTRQSS